MKQLIFWHVTADSTRVGYTVAHLPGRSPWRLLLSFLCFTKGGILWTVPARVSAMIVLRENPFPFKTRCPLTLHSLVWETRDDRLDIHAYASVETPLHPLTALPPKRPRSFPGLSLLLVRARSIHLRLRRGSTSRVVDGRWGSISIVRSHTTKQE